MTNQEYIYEYDIFLSQLARDKRNSRVMNREYKQWAIIGYNLESDFQSYREKWGNIIHRIPNPIGKSGET
ncbi:hypothetical protein Lal_00032632 [Lupinus albus]|nr:hypothetical protein Lal_00032632 [Lupinus albus]